MNADYLVVMKHDPATSTSARSAGIEIRAN